MTDLLYIGKLEKAYKVQTENPINYLWGEFLKFTDIPFIKKVLKDKEDEDYQYIATSIKQANDYYRASKECSLMTRPLLLYYSFLNLTKAVLYLKTETKPNGYHGLCKTNLKTDILDSTVEVNNGVFLDLANNLNYPIEKKKIITLEEFISNTVELALDYSSYFDKPNNILRADVKVYNKGSIELTVDLKLKSKLEANTNIFEDFRPINEINGKIFMNNKDNKGLVELMSKGVVLMEKHFDFSIYPDKYYYLNLNENYSDMPSLLNYFGIMFILSELVRYQPVELYKLSYSEDYSMNWFFKKVCDTSERVYFNLILDYLHGYKIKLKTY